jgi:predicted Fe-Mo cluster-binding NifX family protein
VKIAITAQGGTLDAMMDSRFGRCAYFIFIDPATGEFEAHKNSASEAMGGAGVQAAQSVALQKVQAVISGNFGPKAHQALSAGGIKMFSCHTRTVKEALEDYRNGRLEEVASPTVQEHHGI